MQLESIDSPESRSTNAPVPRDDAQELVELVRKSAGKVVVVVGPRNSGKSQFIREKIVPLLVPHGPVLLFDCAFQITDEALDAVSQSGATVILDSFDRFLSLAEAVREPRLKALFREQRRATIVLLAGTQCLPDIFSLRILAPDILENFFELTELKLATELRRYSSASGAAPSVSEPLIEMLENDLARLAEPTVTPALVAIVDEGVRKGDYDPKRGLVGLLEKYLERTLDRLSSQPGSHESAVEVARAVLKEIAAQHGAVSLAGLAERLDVPADIPAPCQRWLIEASGLLKELPGEGVVVQPPQLRVVLEHWLEEDRNVCARAERYLADGLDGRRKLGTLLPYERFNDIHAQRKLLRTTPEQASFLTLCALRSYPDTDPGPVDYWLRRIGDSGFEISTLVEALGDPAASVRHRVVAILGRFDEPRVHGHLCHAALEDTAMEVRTAAAQSLSVFKNKSPIRDVLTRAASESTGEKRIRAIQALRIFQDEECARFLEVVVSSPGEPAVRKAAISTLVLARCEAAVSALLRIALRDPDEQDRDWARTALAQVNSEALTEFGLNAALQDWAARRPAREGRWWRKLGYWPAASVILVLNTFIHGLPLFFLRAWFTGVVFFAVEVVCLTVGVRFLSRDWLPLLLLFNWLASIVVGAWIARRKRVRSGFGYVLSNWLLAATMLTGGLLFHGLGHWITGRKRKAWQLLGIEMIAVLAILPTLFLENIFNVGIGRNVFDRFTSLLFYLYVLGGVALSWLWAVSWLVIDERWGFRGPWLSEPHSRVLRALLNAPESAVLLRRNLVADQQKARTARMLLRRFGDSVPGTAWLSVFEQDTREGRSTPPEILHCLSRHKNKRGYETVVAEAGKLFDRLSPGQRNQLVGVLASHPTDASVQCLYERRSALTKWDRMRLSLAMIVRPFRGWHWTVRLAASAVAVLAVLLVVDGVRTSLNPGWPQIKELRTLSNIQYPDKSEDIATVAGFLAKRQPARSADELVQLFREADDEYASAMAASLGVVATSDAAVEDPKVSDLVNKVLDSKTQFDRDKAFQNLQRVDVRARAVAALVDVISDVKRPQAVRDAALESLQGATERAEREPSIELVCGFAMLFDKPSSSDTTSITPEQLFELQKLQGHAADMMASVAKESTDTASRSASNAARDAIAARADALALLLRISANPEVKTSALNALEASGSDAAVNAIKVFILFEGTSSGSILYDRSAAGDEQVARTARIQLDTCAMAVDSLRRIQTPTAATAFDELKHTPGLPPEIADKLKLPLGHARAVDLNDQARRLQDSGDLGEALRMSRAAVDADAGFADAHGTLGSILYQKGQLDESLKEFRLATNKAPNYGWAYYMQALILRDKGAYRDAENTVHKALEIAPSYSWSYDLLVDIYLDQGLDRKAVAELRRLQRKSPEVTEIYSQLGYVYHERIAGDDPAAYQFAYEAYQKLVDLLREHDPVQVVSAELDLEESRLTTGRYSQLIQEAPQLLERVGPDADRRMALTLFVLSAQILQHDDTDALKTLAKLENIYDREFRPLNKWHDWTYDGTVLYLEKRVPPSATTIAVLRLVQAVNNTSTVRRGNRPPPAIPQELFDNVRRLLESSTVAAQPEAARNAGSR